MPTYDVREWTLTTVRIEAKDAKEALEAWSALHDNNDLDGTADAYDLTATETTQPPHFVRVVQEGFPDEPYWQEAPLNA